MHKRMYNINQSRLLTGILTFPGFFCVSVMVLSDPLRRTGHCHQRGWGPSDMVETAPGNGM